MNSLSSSVDPCLDAEMRASHRASSDEEHLCSLVTRIASGDTVALGLFHRLTGARLMGVARAILRDRADVEEIVADVYWYVWCSARNFDGRRGRVHAWLLVVCRSKAIDRLRSLRSKGEGAAAAMDSLRGDPVDSVCPGDLLHALERGSALHRTIAQLSPIQQQLLSLAFFEGMTHTEIAATTNLALGTVKSHLRRSLLSIRTVLPLESC
jgi:RNA polymerase sigma-70 factor (ECF subfamily)